MATIAHIRMCGQESKFGMEIPMRPPIRRSASIPIESSGFRPIREPDCWRPRPASRNRTRNLCPAPMDHSCQSRSARRMDLRTEDD